MNNEKEVKASTPQTKGGYVFLIILLFITLLISYWMYNKFIRQPKIENDKNEVLSNQMLNDKYISFVKDTLSKEKNLAISEALFIIDFYPKSKEAEICKTWMTNNKIDFEKEKNESDKISKKLSDESIQRVKANIATNGTQPANDNLHTAAKIISMQFIEDKLKAPSTSDFGNEYYWGKTEENVYIIRGTVDAENSYGAKLRKKWSTKIKFNGGEESDAKNWSLLDIEIIN